ncbi:MAG: hypothetical protein L0Z62_49090 [Gemmataceae bacterium]|nr:hypothetical protein [Gemmataceae bacterium]
MDLDFPSAHSADTSWYAVDRDGHVAEFWSGEAGDVPARAAGWAASEDAPNTDLSGLEEVQPPTPMLLELEGRVLPATTGEWRHVRPYPNLDDPFLTDMLLFLKSEEPVRKPLAAGQAQRLPSVVGVAVYFRVLPLALQRALHEAGECLGCFRFYAGSGSVEQWLTGRGFFYYTHLCENWAPGPYGLELRPSRPVHIDQLPPRLRKAISQVCYSDLCFAQTPHILPHSGACLRYEEEPPAAGSETGGEEIPY